MENFANDIAAKMGNILSSKEHQNLFKKASDQTCCNNDCKCSSESCPCKKDKKSCSKSCGSCSSKKEAMQNVLSRLLRLSEALDQQGFEKQASTVLKVFAKLHHFHSVGELKSTINAVLEQLALRATGRDKEKAFTLMDKVEKGHLLPVVEMLPSLARAYEIELPSGFGAGARELLEKDFNKTWKPDEFLLGGGESDTLNADDSNDLKHEELATLHSRNVPFESLSAEIEELERDPKYSGPLDEGVPFSLMERGIEPIPETRRGGYQRNEIDRFLEGDGEDELSADDCGEIRLPEAELSPETQKMESILSETLGDPIEEVPDTESFDQQEFDQFLEGTSKTDMSPAYEGPQRSRKGLSETDPARIEVGEFPERNSPYGMITEPLSLRNYNPDRATLRSSAFMKLDNYFKKDAKENEEDENKDAKNKKKPTAKLPEKIAKWLSVAASVVLKNSGKKFSEKEQSLFEKLSKAAKAGEARPKHLNRLIAFCEEHKLNVPPAVHELAKTAAYGLFDGDPRGTGTDLEEDEGFEEEQDDSSRAVVKISPKLEKVIVKTMQDLIRDDESLRNDATSLAEQTAETLDHDDWLDDSNHPVWTIAARIDEYENGEDQDENGDPDIDDDDRFENPTENEYEDFY